jgi:hypothetical protein
MKVINIENVKTFINMCIAMNMDPSYVLKQMQLFCEGERGPVLHDNCVVLIDGIRTTNIN